MANREQEPSATSTAKTLDDYFAEFKESTDTKVDVFLGGACNPTTWRFTEAIPRLEAARITYFNPQVKNWREELIEREARAKDNAKVLLFVIDGETRCIASMVEASEYIASGKPVILVVQDVRSGAIIGDEETGPHQLKDLNRGRRFLTDVAKRHKVPVYQSLGDAVQKVIEAVKA